MATSTTPTGIVQTPSFYAQNNFSALAIQSIKAKRAAQEAAKHQAAAQHHAAQQSAAQHHVAAQNAQLAMQQRQMAGSFTIPSNAPGSFSGSFTAAPSFVHTSLPPPSTLTTQPPRSINTSAPPPRANGKVQPYTSTTPRPQRPVNSYMPPERAWSFNNQRTETFSSINSVDADEELILHPRMNRVSSHTITSSQSRYEADAASILKGAFGDTLVTAKPQQVQDSTGAMQQRAALRQQNAPASMLHSLLMKRHGQQKIFLMRHGESEGNVSRFDVLDPNLTQVGAMQAKSWQELVGEFGAEIVLISPLRRTVQTACNAFANENVPFLLCRCAREFGWGCAENTISLEKASMDDMLRELPHGHAVQGIHEALYPGLDDPMDEYESLDRLKTVLASRPENVIMVVCHYGVISALTGSRAKNGDVYECTWGSDDEMKVVARHRNPLADTSCLCG
jgi:broad specificity phosphatase PhoE